MIYASCDSIERIVALVSSADDWVLVFPTGMSCTAAAAYALRHITEHIPARILDQLHAAADLAQTG